MIGLHDQKPMEKRPENEPPFNSKNKTDKKIALLVVLSLIILAILITGAILIYVFVL